MSPTHPVEFSHFLRIPDYGDLQRKLCTFVLLPEDNGDQDPGFNPPDLRVMVRMGDVELSDESHQERLDLDDANQEVSASLGRGE